MNRPAITFYAPSAAGYFKSDSDTFSGGAERQVRLLSDIAANAGWKTRVLTILEERELTNTGVEVVPCWRPGISLVRRIWELAKSISGSPSPVYIRFSRVSLDVLLVVLLARFRRKRLILATANNPICTHAGSKWSVLMKRLLFKGASTVFVQTRFQRKLLEENFNVRPRLVGNRVAFSSFAEARAVDFADRDIDLLWVGAIDSKKGTLRAVEIAAINPGLKLVIIGAPLATSTVYFEELTARVGELANVELIGSVDPAVLTSWYGRAKLLLHTSPIDRGGMTKEGFPNVMLEAWASGVPVVSLAHDPDSAISEFGLGAVVDSEHVSEHVDGFIQDADNWRKAGARCIGYAQSRSSSDGAWLSEITAVIES
jgi:glycosyltransferase involved in cell wall biosynthesis